MITSPPNRNATFLPNSRVAAAFVITAASIIGGCWFSPVALAASPQKTITDSAEYNFYTNAAKKTDPRKRAAAYEEFIKQYPASVVTEEAMEGLMMAYQQAGDSAKMSEIATRVLQMNSRNVRALALLTYLKRNQIDGAPASQAPLLLADAALLAQRGLQVLQTMTPPGGVDSPAVEQLKSASAAIFNGALGQYALAREDFTTAQKSLRAAVEQNPNNVQDVYPLAVAYLQAKPQDAVNGLWYMARALNLLTPNSPVQQQANRAGLYYYKKYYGSEEGWTLLVVQAAKTTLPPK